MMRAILCFLYANVNIELLKKRAVGFDERLYYHSHLIKIENITIHEIFKIYEKQNFIDLLESNNKSLDDKIYELSDKGVPFVFSITKGGLLYDWNFKI
jgi:hypothetical protein